MAATLSPWQSWSKLLPSSSAKLSDPSLPALPAGAAKASPMVYGTGIGTRLDSDLVHIEVQHSAPMQGVSHLDESPPTELPELVYPSPGDLSSQSGSSSCSNDPAITLAPSATLRQHGEVPNMQVDIRTPSAYLDAILSSHQQGTPFFGAPMDASISAADLSPSSPTLKRKNKLRKTRQDPPQPRIHRNDIVSPTVPVELQISTFQPRPASALSMTPSTLSYRTSQSHPPSPSSIPSTLRYRWNSSEAAAELNSGVYLCRTTSTPMMSSASSRSTERATIYSRCSQVPLINPVIPRQFKFPTQTPPVRKLTKARKPLPQSEYSRFGLLEAAMSENALPSAPSNVSVDDQDQAFPTRPELAPRRKSSLMTSLKRWTSQASRSPRPTVKSAPQSPAKLVKRSQTTYASIQHDLNLNSVPISTPPLSFQVDDVSSSTIYVSLRQLLMLI
jgi:hypothetical protein